METICSLPKARIVSWIRNMEKSPAPTVTIGSTHVSITTELMHKWRLVFGRPGSEPIKKSKKDAFERLDNAGLRWFCAGENLDSTVAHFIKAAPTTYSTVHGGVDHIG